MPRPITSKDFEAIYKACDVAKTPKDLPFPPSEWWQAVLVFAITTGWRKEEILEFRREDLDLDRGAIKTRASDNKGGRDDMDFYPRQQSSISNRLPASNQRFSLGCTICEHSMYSSIEFRRRPE